MAFYIVVLMLPVNAAVVVEKLFQLIFRIVIKNSIIHTQFHSRFRYDVRHL